MLFYERDGIDMKAYLPKIREPSMSSVESAISDTTTATKSVVNGVEDDDPKKCSIMWKTYPAVSFKKRKQPQCGRLLFILFSFGFILFVSVLVYVLGRSAEDDRSSHLEGSIRLLFRCFYYNKKKVYGNLCNVKLTTIRAFI